MLWPIDLNSFLQDCISNHSEEPFCIFGAAFFMASFIGEDIFPLEVIWPETPSEAIMLEEAPP